MSLWSSIDATKATGGDATRPFEVNGISIDTRTLKKGDLFIALKDQRDGHDFVEQAFDKGAAAALVTHRPEGVADDAPLLIVPDVLKGLEDLGRAARARMLGQVIAVTGSVGKTSTKEMLRSALAGQGLIHAAESSFNNHWGVPLTLARMPAATDFAVIEIGMNAPGEIAPLSRMARPHVALITTVAEAHMAAFKDSIKDGATMVIARRSGRKFSFKIGAPGKHLAMNALGVMAAVEAAGGDTARAALALAHWTPPEGRGVRHQIRLGDPSVDGMITLIDESYNANPTSMAAALDALAATETRDGIGRISKGRRIAILGDMLELGPKAKTMHADLAHLAAMEAVDRVHLVGVQMGALAEALPQRKLGLMRADATALAKDIRAHLDAGDVVMVKASKGTGLGLVVDAIRSMGITAQSLDRETT